MFEKELHNGSLPYFGRPKNLFKRAFTLVEVMLSVALLSVVMIALTGLFVSTLRANEANFHSLTAYNLAQEEIELVRNSRDSNWLQNFGWIGTTGFIAPMDLTASLVNVGDYSYYVFSGDLNSGSDSGLRYKELGRYSDEVDVWAKAESTLCEIPPTDLLSPVGSYLINNFDAGSCDDFYSGSKESMFKRFVKIKVLEKDSSGLMVSKIMVVSTVIWWEPWNDDDKPRRIDIATELSDWKGGPI